MGVTLSGELSGKRILVTGGASGIGAAVATRAAAQGASVIVADRDGAKAEAVAACLPLARAEVVDIADPTSVDALFNELEARDLIPDSLIHCAGIWEMGSLLDAERASYQRLFTVNVEGCFLTLQCFARLLVRHGREGAIVTFASQAGRRGEAQSALYAATKAAVISLTQSAALDLVSKGIRVNAVAPGNIDTPMWKTVDATFTTHQGQAAGEKAKSVALQIPMGRFAAPEEVAEVALFLSSDRASYVTGQTWNVDGGNFLS